MIVELNGRQVLSGFNQSQIRKLLQGFEDEIMNDIDGERGVRSRRVIIRLAPVGDPSFCINGSVRCTCCQRYDSFRPEKCIG